LPSGHLLPRRGLYMKKQKNALLMRLAINTLSVAAILMVMTSILAADDFTPVIKPTLSTKQATGLIKIDGDLSDPGWKNVGHVTDFVERNPGENIKPAVKTDAYLTYDKDYLYVAFVCYDDPNDLRATMCQRDQYEGDDLVGILIDTYGESSWGYELFVNPHGVQKDRLWTMTGGEDVGFDLIWNSAAQITDSGYQVEIAVPFTGMRFPNRDEQSWRVEFWRNRPRDSYYQYSWGADDRNDQCFACKWGTVTGIRNVHPGKGFEILPSLVGRQSGYRRPKSINVPFENEDPDVELSLGGKFSVSSSTTIEGYYNPDFSQVEADAAQIDVNSTIELLFPERRPFFQEGADIFRTYFNSFYTRTVWNPIYAAKLIQRTERNSIGFMTALDENSPYSAPFEEEGSVIDAGKSYVNVLRGQRTFGNSNQVGFMLTDRRFEGGGSGSIATVDGRIRLTPALAILGQFIVSHTAEPDHFTHYLDSLLAATPDSLDRNVRDSVLNDRKWFDFGRYTEALDGESYYGHALIAEIRRFGRDWTFMWDYNEVSPSYRTQTGYDPWNNQRNSFVDFHYNFYPEKSIFVNITPEINVDGRWNFEGIRKWRHATISLNSALRVAQTSIGIAYSRGEELWGGIQYNGLWSARFSTDCRLSDMVGTGFNLSFSRNPALSVGLSGDENSLSAYAELKPLDRLTIVPTTSYVRSSDVNQGVELFRQFIGRTRLELQLNTRLSVRLVVQYNDLKMRYTFPGAENWPVADLPVYKSKRWDIDPLITYRISPFSLFYIGSTQDYNDLNTDPDKSSNWRITERHFFMKLQYLFQT